MQKQAPIIWKGFKPIQQFNTQQALTNFMFFSVKTYNQFLQANEGRQPVYIQIKDFVYIAQPFKEIAGDNELAMNKIVRSYLRVSVTDTVDICLFNKHYYQEYRLSHIVLEVSPKAIASSSGRVEVEDKDIIAIFRKFYLGQFLRTDQIILIDYEGSLLEARVCKTQQLQSGTDSGTKFDNLSGIIVDETDIEMQGKLTPNFKLKSSSTVQKNIFRPDFKFEDMGIGGLDKEITEIFRRAFASRRFSPAVLEKYGHKHVKGLLLFGPPGTGKTLIARQLAKALKSKEPKIVNGPEIFNKYVGQTEENIRDLFKEAIQDQRTLGDESPLHIIIFDEFDAICRSRGSTQSGTGVHDSAVNQLLAMMDGVESLNNILLIGMTNRKDMLDEAVLRPGRFEVHIEVNLPDEKGRKQIFDIHTKSMKQNNLMSTDVDLDKLSKSTKNYTGAEIEAVVKSAASFAFERYSDLMNFSHKVDKTDAKKVMQESQVEMNDFVRALDEVRPQFGADTDRLELLLRNGIINYGPKFDKVESLLKDVVEQTKTGKSSSLVSVLLDGSAGTGKSALSAYIAQQSNFPYAKLITPDNFVGFSELGKINAMAKIFEDAYRSPLSLVILDDIERILEYVDLGPRFSNPILQTILVLVKRPPKKPENRLLIIGTTSSRETLKNLDLLQAFNIIVKLPQLEQVEEISTVLDKVIKNKDVIKHVADKVTKISLKKLLMIIDMTTKGTDILDPHKFIQCVQELNHDEFQY